MKQAETFLQDNLNGEQLTPASKEWRDSLFALGELLHNAGRDREAIQRLEEALQRYPNAPQATVARYLLADSSRRLAMDLRAGLGKEISSAVRGERTSESRRLLERALEVYGFLQDDLSRRDAENLTAQEKAVLRNSRFAVGDTYFDLGALPRGPAGLPVGGEPLCGQPGSARRLFADCQRLPPHGPAGRGPHVAGAGPPGPAADSARRPFRTNHQLSTASNGANSWTACAVCEHGHSACTADATLATET